MSDYIEYKGTEVSALIVGNDGSVTGVPRANPTAYQVFISKLAYDSIVFHGKRQGKVTQVYPNQAVWIGEPWNGDCALIKESNVHEFEVQP